MSFFDTSPPRRGGSQALFDTFSSLQGRQSRPYLTLLLPTAVCGRLLVDLVVGSNQENDHTFYLMVGSMAQIL